MDFVNAFHDSVHPLYVDYEDSNDAMEQIGNIPKRRNERVNDLLDRVDALNVETDEYNSEEE